ncbi:MAG: AbrB/MazE/SpoVT family DNA-binding domain-containing protein [Actinobacteria bacterium]|nr:AbrB/MazE/SpoVT family DNA-binding domain-containing protein [Actinomycetota bacterium]
MVSGEEKIDVLLRPKRQVTLPFRVCEKLGLEFGDRLEIEVRGNAIIARPKKTVALEALKEIRDAFKKSGITEDELLKSVEEKRHGKT